jgi:hypothetical protein
MVREHEGETTVKRLLIAASLIAMLAFPATTQAFTIPESFCHPVHVTTATSWFTARTVYFCHALRSF